MAQTSLDSKEKERKARLVPAFSVSSYGKNVETGKAPSAKSLVPRPIPPTRFRQCYLRSDFPIQLEFLSSGQKLAWKVELERLDFHYYLPLFFGGLMETSHPYAFLARQAVHDMLMHGGAKITAVIPQLIMPISVALNTRHPRIIAMMIKAIQALINAHSSVGPALLPYYRQILPIFNLFKNKNVNLGDGIEFNQRKRMNLGDLIQETLELMERTGGPHAFINIKYMVPTYESAMQN